MSYDTTTLEEIAEALDHAAKVAKALADKHAQVGEDGSMAKQDARRERNEAWAKEVRKAIAELKKPRAKKLVAAGVPQSDGAQAIGRLFKRRSDTPWAGKEIVALRAIEASGELTPENMTLLELYYAAERKKGDAGIHRRDLCTFLNNFAGELDRARAHAKVNERDPRRAPAHADPPRWDQFLKECKLLASPFEFAPALRKEQFAEWERANGF